MTRGAEDGEELVPLPVERRTAAGARPGLHDGPPEGSPGGPFGGAADGAGLHRRWAGDRAGLDRRWRAIGLGALLAVLVGAAALNRSDRRPAAPAAPAAPVSGAPAPAGADESAPPGWRRGSPGPLRYRNSAVRVWTGSELVVWGGDPDGDSGAAYDPAADRWRIIAPAPIPARCQGASAWTGREVLVWGEACRLSPGPAPGPRHDLAAAAYDPAADRWRVLPTGPVTGGQSPLSVWTGTEWLLANSVGPAAAFDPVSDRWRPLPGVPRPYLSIVGHWTGRDVLVFGVDVLEKGPSTVGSSLRHWAAAFDPGGGGWRPLPDPPLELAATAVWDGRRLIAWDQNLHSAALAVDADAGWEALADLPLEFTDCSPEGVLLGDVVFAEHCGHGAVFRPEAETWERVPHPRSLAELPVWTGTEALFWVGSFTGSADGVWLYRPPAQ